MNTNHRLCSRSGGVVVVVIVVDIDIVFLLGPQAHQGGAIFRRPGSLVRDWDNTMAVWEKIGTLGCEGKDAEDPKDDIPETWGFSLSDETLLEGATPG